MATKTKTRGKAVAKTSRKSTALAGSVDDFAKLASAGMETVDQTDIIIPRLGILQKLSPQLQKRDPEFIKGAEEGMFCDIGTGEVFPDEVVIVPCFYAKVYLEWAPRKSALGLVKNHGTDGDILDECTPNDKGKMILPNGNTVEETATYYCINVSAGNRRSFIPLSSSQLKASRKWMGLLTAETLETSDGVEFTPPMFYRSWRATPVEHTNAEGDWMGWKFEPDMPITEIDPSGRLKKLCIDYYQQAMKGIVQGDVSAVERTADLDM